MKLFGTLSNQWPDYDHEKGLIIELPEGAIINDLINSLKLGSSRIGMVCINNQKVNPDDTLIAEAEISIFQPICGG
ncbi:MAG: hypothetical protein HOD92_22535 [Deltaproteobacteria bacterium]|nr:hypothetical protein [Deltaproteobacteria bacterium]